MKKVFFIHIHTFISFSQQRRELKVAKAVVDRRLHWMTMTATGLNGQQQRHKSVVFGMAELNEISPITIMFHFNVDSLVFVYIF